MASRVWWWTDKTRDFIDVRGWDIDPQTGFSLLWEMNLDNPVHIVGGGYVNLASAAFGGGAKRDLVVANNDQLRWFVGGPGGAPTLHQHFTLANNYIIEMFVADLDLDGNDDVITINASRQVTLWVNTRLCM